MIEIQFMKEMSDSQKLMFQSQYNHERKSTTTCLLWAFFLGGIGAHHFYMGKVGWGILYAVFVWTFIPSVLAFIELFFIPSRVENYNKAKASQIAAMIQN